MLFLSETAPSDVYRSCAYYEHPEAEMDKKVWLGADLVFDIDADHIPTSCNKLHDLWVCKKCGLANKGVTAKKCSKCGSKHFNLKNWPCEKCLNSARKETEKLVAMLKQDFGFLDEEIHVFFSGHRGYHVQVENDAVASLDSLARKEIVDYVTGLDLTISTHGRKKYKKMSSERFFLSDFSWNKRIKKRMATLISTANENDLRNIGLGSASALILNDKNLVLERCIGEGLWRCVPGVGPGTWKKLAIYAKDLESANIDTVVTTDTHRLIRMNGTLHGKTGLVKVEFPVNRIAEFDPFEEAVAFKGGSVKLSVSDAPELRLGGKLLGPFKDTIVEVPTAAAVLLICKGRAEVVN
jgi:DNA primase small subunit